MDCIKRGVVLLEQDCITHYNYRELESCICYDIYEDDIFRWSSSGLSLSFMARQTIW